MRIRTLVLCLAFPAAFAAAGCNNTSSSGGGVGSTKPDGTTNTAATAKFEVKGPMMATSIKQGDRQTVAVTLARGSDFKHGVKLAADAPKGLTVDLSSKSVAAGDKSEQTLTVEAAKDAPLGEHIVKITATPDIGAATTLDVKVKVEEKK